MSKRKSKSASGRMELFIATFNRTENGVRFAKSIMVDQVMRNGVWVDKKTGKPGKTMEEVFEKFAKQNFRRVGPRKKRTVTRNEQTRTTPADVEAGEEDRPQVQADDPRRRVVEQQPDGCAADGL